LCFSQTSESREDVSDDGAGHKGAQTAFRPGQAGHEYIRLPAVTAGRNKTKTPLKTGTTFERCVISAMAVFLQYGALDSSAPEASGTHIYPFGCPAYHCPYLLNVR